MNIPAAIQKARELAEGTLTDTVTVTRVATTTDDIGRVTETDPVTIYHGPGLVQLVVSRSTPVVESAGQIVDVQFYVAKLPVTADPQFGDTITVDASLSPQHVGRSWRFTGHPTQGLEVLRRCPVDLIDPDPTILP